MSKSQMFRALVSERLSAAAEDIFALFERTITEYEEELCRSKVVNQRQQQQYGEISPRVLLHRVNVHIPVSPDPGVKQETIEIRVNVEEDLPVSYGPEFTDVRVKRENSPAFQHREFEHVEETHEDISFHRQADHFSDTNNDDEWRSKSTEADVNHSNQVQTRDQKIFTQNSGLSPKPELEMNGEDWRSSFTDADIDCINQSTATKTSSLSPKYKAESESSATVNNVDMSQMKERAERKKPQCTVCDKRFEKKRHLRGHCKIHTGEKPFSCSISEETFAVKDVRKSQRPRKRLKRVTCSVCKKSFSQNYNLTVHMRTHTGEKPFSCSICNKKFAVSSSRDAHKRTHTGEKPVSCLYCKRPFSRKSNLVVHMRTHTGDKPFSCSICGKAFVQKVNLKGHLKTHEGKDPSAA